MPPKGLSIFAIRTANSRGWCPYFPVGARNQRTSFSLTDFKKNFLENRMKATSRIKKKVIYTVSTGGRTASNFSMGVIRFVRLLSPVSQTRATEVIPLITDTIPAGRLLLTEGVLSFSQIIDNDRRPRDHRCRQQHRSVLSNFSPPLAPCRSIFNFF